MDIKQVEWINSSDLPPFFRDEVLGPAAHVTKRYFRTAKGQLDPARVKMATPFVVSIVGTGKRGIGVSIVLSYAKAGASGILLSSRTEASLKHVAEQVKAINPSCRVEYQVCDVCIEDDLVRLASRCKECFGRLDVAVLNQSDLPRLIQNKDGSLRFPYGLYEETREDVSNSWDTNYHGSYLAIKALLPLIRISVDGPQSIIILSSIGALSSETSPTTCTASYITSKFAVTRLAEFVHNEFKSDGVLCFAIHPGCIKINDDFPIPWDFLIDDVSLPGGFCVWLTKMKRAWLSGRFLVSGWDVTELESQKERIVAEDKFKFRLVV
ncbi:Short-chain dehydrogenase/reductase SDR [Penicillium canescens]|uniref:Short-chain dehydrogenase/reductase SDR n=1 Tax=Penicillium canescens TaxID=5083 RepID=A0AAD6ND77_PENCN|nr:Short-chain dehydrogenase/reductase SDR [Penicillium canescens]KAJ5991624.1 Short-chain dehydrogenase/reductase SDR [Penicillium canescens]KAJ6049122.1 Short-chain dehydrogenase/reductase SDR [Penicillium canescens]KAJ6052905.1 Short-chain dehydrogenase/reductase SDR [Penicillium canescens]KAJ6063431.1 Short-chain dehydrogenase/reductase SDR [Penicillium canescens]KAJ6089191.1 Short-chain dehydrogenase/reductase SDR [Penicillium canescens]